MREMRMGSRGVAAMIVVAVLGAGAAQAQGVPPGCQANGNPNGAVAGALLGGVAGALLGNAVSGRRKAGGTIIGGVTGAAAGAMIGGSQPCPEGYVYRAEPRPYDEPQPLLVREESDDVWYGAPPTMHDRIVFLRHRVERLDHEGWLSPRESDGLFHRLSEVALKENRAKEYNDGHLPPEIRARLDDDLNDVARHLRWKEYRSQHADR